MDMNYRGGGSGREGVGRMQLSEGGKWDNCNSIINKYIKKKRMKGAEVSWRKTEEGWLEEML